MWQICKVTTRGEGWPRPSDFVHLLQLTPSETYLRLLWPVQGVDTELAYIASIFLRVCWESWDNSNKKRYEGGGGDTEPWNIMECFPDLWCLQTSMIITHNNSTGNTCYVGQNRLHCQYLERWAVCERNTPTPRKS